MFNIRERIRTLGKRQPVKVENKVEDHDHRAQVQQMLKIIWTCEMPEHLKRVMTSRIWGLDPAVFYPLTCEQMFALNIGMNPVTVAEIEKENPDSYNAWCEENKGAIDQIREYERQGRFHCEQFLLSVRAEDIVGRFNSNFARNKGQMFTKMPFERKSFTA